MALPLREEVRSLLNDIQSALSALEDEARKNEDRTVPARIVQLQSSFQKIVVSVAEFGLTPTVEQRLRPLQTEGHRRLKLAGIAGMRLKAAKQAETIATVEAQISEHLLQLQKFVEAMADELCDLE